MNSIVRNEWPEARKAVIRAIEHAYRSNPRQRQTRIGPSEIGVPCDRYIAYTLLEHPKHDTGINWRSTVGTAVHTWLQTACDNWDLDLIHIGVAHDDTGLHWLTEQKVTVGTLGDTPITGSFDLYHRPTRTLIDHKIVSPTSLRHKRTNGPGNQYRSQLHLYAHGATLAGLPVDHVAINFLPSAGELKDQHWWTEPYEPLIAQTAWLRLTSIHDHTLQHGVDGVFDLPAAEHYCGTCPFHTAHSTNPRTGCPGAATTPAKTGFEGLLAHTRKEGQE